MLEWILDLRVTFLKEEAVPFRWPHSSDVHQTADFAREYMLDHRLSSTAIAVIWHVQGRVVVM